MCLQFMELSGLLVTLPFIKNLEILLFPNYKALNDP